MRNQSEEHNLRETLAALEGLKSVPLAVYSAKEEYLKRMKDNRRSSDNTSENNQQSQQVQNDPRVVEFETKAYIELFEKHKIAYWEYETKVEFLKLLITDPEEEEDNEEESRRRPKKTAYDAILAKYTDEQNTYLEAKNAAKEDELDEMMENANVVQKTAEENAKTLAANVEEISKMENDVEEMLRAMVEMEKEIESLEGENDKRQSEIGYLVKREVTEIEDDEASKKSARQDDVNGLDGLRRLEEFVNQQGLDIKDGDLHILLNEQREKNKRLEADITKLQQELEPQDSKKPKETKNSNQKSSRLEILYSLLGQLSGIDTKSLFVKPQGPYNNLIKFTKNAQLTLNKSEKESVSISFQMLIEKASEKLLNAQLLTVKPSDLFSKDDLSTISAIAFEKAFKIGESSPAYFVNFVTQEVQKRVK